jgi:hypothetical protein
MDVTVYDESTGLIIESFGGGQDFVSRMIGNRRYIQGGYSSLDYYVENGVAVKFPERPENVAVAWNHITKSWDIDLVAVEANIRAQRDGFLFSSDWTQLPDVPLATKEAWAAYRQDLRDITAQSGFPLNINWPTAPA